MGRAIRPDYWRMRRRATYEKSRAREKLRTAVRAGKITRGPCEVCGQPNGEAHHEDYTKPLDVKWLCLKHHRELHKKLKNQP